MCKCQQASVAGTRKPRKKRKASVAGIAFTKPKDMVNVETGGAAVVTVIAITNIDKVAKDSKMAKQLFQTEEGGMYCAIGGAAGAFLIPGKGTGAKIFRGLAAGVAAHGAKVWLTGENWGGDAVLGEKMDSIEGLWYPGGGNGGGGNQASAGGASYR